MLDRYWFGDVGRISPEAPVPVVKITGSKSARAAPPTSRAMPRRSGAQASLLSVVGRDEAGALLRRLLKKRRVAGAACTRDGAIQTTIKLRVIGRRQQLLRIDFETPPSHEVLASKLRDFKRAAASMRRGDTVGLRQGRAHAHRAA